MQKILAVMVIYLVTGRDVHHEPFEEILSEFGS